MRDDDRLGTYEGPSGYFVTAERMAWFRQCVAQVLEDLRDERGHRVGALALPSVQQMNDELRQMLHSLSGGAVAILAPRGERTSRNPFGEPLIKGNR